MFKSKKVGGSQQVRETEKHRLRMLRSDQPFQASLVSVERTDREDVWECSRKDIRAAVLVAEQKKARALLAFQYNRRFY